MKQPIIAMLLLVPLFSLFVLSACSDTTEPNASEASQKMTESEEVVRGELGGPQGDLDARSKELRQQIRDVAEQPVASKISECRIAGIGSKPCGGPESYIIYSVQNTDEGKLLPVIDEYNTVRRMLNEKHGMISECSVLPEPTIALRNGFCAPVPAAEM